MHELHNCIRVENFPVRNYSVETLVTNIHLSDQTRRHQPTLILISLTWAHLSSPHPALSARAPTVPFDSHRMLDKCVVCVCDFSETGDWNGQKFIHSCWVIAVDGASRHWGGHSRRNLYADKSLKILLVWCRKKGGSLYSFVYIDSIFFANNFITLAWWFC